MENQDTTKIANELSVQKIRLISMYLTELQYRRQKDSIYAVQLHLYDGIIADFNTKDNLNNIRNSNNEAIIKMLQDGNHWFDHWYISYPLGVLTTGLAVFLIK